MPKPCVISNDLFWIGALDKNLRRFDIVMETEFGTTYNAYLLKGSSAIAVIETVKDCFFDDYINNLKEIADPSDITYIIANHTEPDHVGSIEKLLKIAPNAIVIGTSIAIKYLSQIINSPFKSQTVKDGDIVSLGDKTLRFITAPLLHWPDTMYTYVEELNVLFTCDSFGAHYCDERILRDKLDAKCDDNYLKAYKYYFDMIMGPFKPFVLSALNKIQNLKIDYICPGHGMVLSHTHISSYIELYKQWSTPIKKDHKRIVIAYVSAYGYTKTLANTIASTISSSYPEIEVLCYDLVETDLTTTLNAIELADGLLIGSPTILADTLPPVWNLLTSLNPIIHKGIKAGCFGSYGWSGEATTNIMNRFSQLKFNVCVEPLKFIFKPSEEECQKACDFAHSFVQCIQQ